MTIEWRIPENFFNTNFAFPVVVPNYYNANVFPPIFELNFSQPPAMPVFNYTAPDLNNFKTNTSINTNTNLPTVSSKITGNTDIISVALKYKGYNEIDGSCSIFGGSKSIPWCALFATYVARENGSKIPHFSAVKDILDWGKDPKNNKFHKTPKLGDALILRGPSGNAETGKSHTGIVDKIENGKVRIIAGNSGRKNKGSVTYEWYDLTDPNITGYVSMV